MNYQEFLRALVEDSVRIITEEWKQMDDPLLHCMLEGGRAGALACRDKSPPELNKLLQRARGVHRSAFHSTIRSRYWRITYFLHEVEWICNVISFVLVNQDMQPIVRPTIKAAKTAARITEANAN